jgi:ABC-type multidrug transport system permease subunit
MEAGGGEGSASESTAGGGEEKKKWMKMGAKITMFIVIAIAFVVLWPFAFIWALNTVFLLGVPLNFWTWLATVVILLTFGFLFSFGRNSDMK